MNDALIEVEKVGDVAAGAAVHRAGFGQPNEATLVDRLRASAHPQVSLVARLAERVIGHIFFSPVELAGAPDLLAMGLAPVGIVPEWQRSGVGGGLVRAGLDACRALGARA